MLFPGKRRGYNSRQHVPVTEVLLISVMPLRMSCTLLSSKQDSEWGLLGASTLPPANLILSFPRLFEFF